MENKTLKTVVFSTLDIATAQLAAHHLKSEKLEVEIRGEHRISLGGEIPLNDARVEVLVAEVDAPAAEVSLARLFAESRPEWVCNGCGESNPGNFEHCWHCAQDRIYSP